MQMLLLRAADVMVSDTEGIGEVQDFGDNRLFTEVYV